MHCMTSIHKGGQWLITLHDYVHYAQQCVPYAAALQCSHARNLTLRDDYKMRDDYKN